MIHRLLYWFGDLFTPQQNVVAFWSSIVIAMLLFVGVMAALHYLSPSGKKWLTIICTFVAGLYFMVEYLWPVRYDAAGQPAGNFLTPTVPEVSQFVTIIVVWTILLGLISLTLVHGKRLINRLPGWHNSLAFFIALIAMMLFGFWSQTNTSNLNFMPSRIYDTLFRGMLINLDAAMFSLLAFYIASAAYRAFRVRTLEAGLLMASALIVMLGMVSTGVLLTSWIDPDSAWSFLRIEKLALWILQWINMPSQRAVVIGVEIGALAMALRLWLSLERGAFFAGEK